MKEGNGGNLYVGKVARFVKKKTQEKEMPFKKQFSSLKN